MTHCMLREAHLGAAAMMCLADAGRAEPCIEACKRQQPDLSGETTQDSVELPLLSRLNLRDSQLRILEMQCRTPCDYSHHFLMQVLLAECY